jgi:hypothetical protein
MTTQAAAPLSGVEQRLASIESRLAALEATMALFIEEQRQYREEQRAEQREFRQENNVRLGRVETNLTRVYLTIIGLMGTIIVGGIILRVLG